MNSIRDEKHLLRLTFFLGLIVFANLYLLKEPYDTGAIVLAVVMFLIMGYAYFIVRRFFPDGDKYILIFACIFSIIGVAMLYRIDWTVAVRQVVWFILGMAGFIVIVVLLPDLKSFAKYKYVYLVFTIIFMSMATLFGREVYGATNWVFIGGMGFQPSEFGKLFLAAYLASSLKDYKTFRDLFEPAAVVMVTLGFMVLQRDLGSALIFFGLSVTVLYIATAKVKYVITCLALFIIGGAISYRLFGHVRIRFMIWRNPWPYAYGESFQVIQSLFSIATGSLFGTGLGRGFPQFIPVNTTDFIFAVISEELGMIVGFGIIILYFLLFYRSMRAAIYIKDKFSRLLAVGYSAMIASQVLVIIGGVVNAIPLTGLTLPLVSYGGSSMLTTFFALGILQKISEDI